MLKRKHSFLLQLCNLGHSPGPYILAIARKQFFKAKQLCNFVSYYQEALTPINHNTYLLYSKTAQNPTFNCQSITWNQTTIDAGITVPKQ